jgi:hypothetical protein
MTDELDHIEAKDAVAETFQRLGGVKAMVAWAKKNHSAFFSMYAKLIPLSLNANATVDHKHSVENDEALQRALVDGLARVIEARRQNRDEGKAVVLDNVGGIHDGQRWITADERGLESRDVPSFEQPSPQQPADPAPGDGVTPRPKPDVEQRRAAPDANVVPLHREPDATERYIEWSNNGGDGWWHNLPGKL